MVYTCRLKQKITRQWNSTCRPIVSHKTANNKYSQHSSFHQKRYYVVMSFYFKTTSRVLLFSNDYIKTTNRVLLLRHDQIIIPFFIFYDNLVWSCRPKSTHLRMKWHHQGVPYTFPYICIESYMVHPDEVI